MAETTDRGMFDFLKKKEDELRDDTVMIDSEITQTSELKKKKEEEKHTLMEELHRTGSNSISQSSDEEVEGGERRKKKKKGLKEKIKDKISGTEKEEEAEHKDASLPVEKCNNIGIAEAPQPEEKKGFLEKIKEKLPEKKGIMEKIKDKLPGSHKNGEEEKKEN